MSPGREPDPPGGLLLDRSNAGTSARTSPVQPLPTMLRWAFIFLVFGLIAALFGFTTVAGTAIGIAKILFYIFLVLFLVALLLGLAAGKRLGK